ncbi:hypothetical protein G7062_11045 [Erysipelothrix sp. HDW6C]|uniref:hypothetical protein n=1 Tax=Erysipelothrix sp. HDW6C TaxID=2714930 RepID=UPI00140E8675|nr:hypothetical protein [Erysipelothrix sp. HDW6C]QIK70796.1 hypothetical protein G7062_11045 [Erysipelothrix sp. HDW6C]
MIYAIFGIIVMTAAIILQVRLAKESNPRYSLMLPGLFALSSIMATLFTLITVLGNSLEYVIVFTLGAFFITIVPSLIMFITRYIVRKKHPH